MSWQDRLVYARFRGLEFLTESHDSKDGRRLVVHEFPGSDVPEVEDLGAKAWDGRLVAYFIGEDYDLECNGLLAKLAEPGAEWLTHPWLGLRWVRAHHWARHESNDKGGFASVSIEFVEGGGSQQPTQDVVDKASWQLVKFSDAAVDGFSLPPISAGGMTSFIAAVQARLESIRSLISLATLPLTWASQLTNLVAGASNDLGALMALPASYAAALRGVADLFGSGADGDYSAASDGSGYFPAADRARLAGRLCNAALVPSSNTGGAGGDSAVSRCLRAEGVLRRCLLVSAAGQVALADYAAEADRDAALLAVTAAIDALLPVLPDAVFEVAVATRTALIEALLAQDLTPTETRTVVKALPAVVLAHRLRVDESVFVAQNKVRHPLFVSGDVHG